MMDEYFNELEELEIMDLIDRRNVLMNQIEADNEGLIDLSEQEYAEIQDKLEEIYEKLDLLY